MQDLPYLQLNEIIENKENALLFLHNIAIHLNM